MVSTIQPLGGKLRNEYTTSLKGSVKIFRSPPPIVFFTPKHFHDLRCWAVKAINGQPSQIKSFTCFTFSIAAAYSTPGPICACGWSGHNATAQKAVL